MASLNSTLHLLTVTNSTASTDTGKHTGIQIQWVPLLILLVLVVLIIIVIAMPKGWMITFYNGLRNAKNPFSTLPSPRRIFPFFPSRKGVETESQEHRREGSIHQRRESDVSFISFHLRDIRGYKKPDLHPDKERKRVPLKRFLGSRTLGVLRYS